MRIGNAVLEQGEGNPMGEIISSGALGTTLILTAAVVIAMILSWCWWYLRIRRRGD